VLFYGQVIPGSTLIAYVNADHWAMPVPVARTHPTIGYLFADRNDYPREALLDAILRLSKRSSRPQQSHPDQRQISLLYARDDLASIRQIQLIQSPQRR
jgi:hypothetical protein